MKGKLVQKVVKVLIAVPCFQTCEPEVMRDIYRLNIPDNVETSLEFVLGYGVAQARNESARFALANGFDYILFVDSDVLVPKSLLEELLKLDSDIAAGWYKRKREQQFAEVYVWETDEKKAMKKLTAEDISKLNTCEINACGFGCALVKTELFKKIPDYTWFNFVETSQTQITEDLNFCLKAAKAGAKIMLEPRLQCVHIMKVGI